MNEYDKRIDFFTTIHLLAQMNISVALSQTSQTEFLALSAIDKLGRLKGIHSISGIADSLHVSSPAVCRTISALESKGYVERSIDKDNRRNTNVMLTASGENVLMNEGQRISSLMSSVADRMGEEKVAQLLSLSNELVQSLDKELKNRRASGN